GLAVLTSGIVFFGERALGIDRTHQPNLAMRLSQASVWIGEFAHARAELSGATALHELRNGQHSDVEETTDRLQEDQNVNPRKDAVRPDRVHDAHDEEHDVDKSDRAEAEHQANLPQAASA